MLRNIPHLVWTTCPDLWGVVLGSSRAGVKRNEIFKPGCLPRTGRIGLNRVLARYGELT